MSSKIVALTSGGGVSVSGDTSGVLELQTNNGTTAMTIDTSQNVGIGTSSPAVKLHVNGSGSIIRVATDTSSSGTIDLSATSTSAVINANTYATAVPLVFQTASTERARIDTSGNLLVGTTTNTYGSRLSIKSNNDNVAAQFYRLGTGSGSAIVLFSSNAGGTESLKSYIDVSSGGLTVLSDERKKENLVPITGAVDKVSQLRSVVGNYIGDESKHPFLIAQDVQSVLPEAVSVMDKGSENEFLGLSYTDTIPLLVAAIKEQQAIITDLKARIETLEGAKA